MIKSLSENAPPSVEGGLLADRATDHIRAMISAGRLCSGDRLNEVEIAAEMSISRGPVREAVRRFASAGLVVSEPNLGSRVITIDAAAVRGLYEVREALETMAARLAAERMGLVEKRRLVEMLDQHAEAMRSEGTTDTYPAGNSDWDFHLAILRGADNAVAWRICGNELRDMFSLLRARHGRIPGRGKLALQEHRLVAEAIYDSDGDLAAVLMARHIRNSHRNQITLMSAGGTQEDLRKERT